MESRPPQPSAAELYYMEQERLRQQQEAIEHQNWWNSLTPEQQARVQEEEAEKAKLAEAARKQSEAEQRLASEEALKKHDELVRAVTTAQGLDTQQRIAAERDRAERTLSSPGLSLPRFTLFRFVFTVGLLGVIGSLGWKTDAAVSAGVFIGIAAWALIGLFWYLEHRSYNRARDFIADSTQHLGCGDASCPICFASASDGWRSSLT